MTSASYSTAVHMHLPDCPYRWVGYELGDLATAGEEAFPDTWAYRVRLDVHGEGTIMLPTPDNTGAATWSWNVYLPDDPTTYNINLPYSNSTQELADLLAEYALSLPAAAALLSTKADVVAGTAGDLAQLVGDGQLEDSGLLADDLAQMLLPTVCYCQMNVGVNIPPGMEVAMPLQVVKQTEQIHPGGLAATMTIPRHGIYTAQAIIYTGLFSLSGYYLDAKIRKNQADADTIIGWNRQPGLPTATTAQVMNVIAPSVDMAEDDTVEVYLSHNYTAPITFFVQRLTLRRHGDYA